MMGLKTLCFATFIVFIYTILMIRYFQNHLDKRLPKQPSPPQTLLVLLSQPRSGSSYLGKLISESLRSVYFYEPLYELDKSFNIDINFAHPKQRQAYDLLTTNYLHNMLQCNFQKKEEWMRIFNSKFKTLNTLKTRSCSEKSPNYQFKHCIDFIFNSFHLQKECREYHLMVKLLEMRIPNQEAYKLTTLVHSSTRYKIIYLIRDPRASFWSLLKKGWVSKTLENSSFTNYVTLRCNEMFRNIQDVKRNKNFLLLRYEDLVSKPDTSLEGLYSFLGEEVSNRMHQKLIPCYVPIFNSDAHANITESIERKRENYLCFTVNKWRYMSNERFVRLVESRCESVMKLLGYRLVGEEVYMLKDFNQPLVLSHADYDATITEV